jgi:hypothetical protein
MGLRAYNSQLSRRWNGELRNGGSGVGLLPCWNLVPIEAQFGLGGMGGHAMTVRASLFSRRSLAKLISLLGGILVFSNCFKCNVT